jgi:hypothetical protein
MFKFFFQAVAAGFLVNSYGTIPGFAVGLGDILFAHCPSFGFSDEIF